MGKLLDLLGDVMLMLCTIAGIAHGGLVFVYLAMESGAKQVTKTVVLPCRSQLT